MCLLEFWKFIHVSGSYAKKWNNGKYVKERDVSFNSVTEVFSL